MAYCCSQCSFTAQFESALTMHHQLHHEIEDMDKFPDSLPMIKEKAKTMPRDSSPTTLYSRQQNKGIKLPGRTSSATKLFGKLRARICRSKTLFSHPEEPADQTLNITDLTARSECTSKGHLDSARGALDCLKDIRPETYCCHLCNFDADRITVLDRHLLNDHKIGLENLLKLVLAKTKDGLAEDPPQEYFGIRQPYYKPIDEIYEDGEFLIETVTPKVKILKHSATNTEIQWTDIPELKDNCRMISKELSKLMKYPSRIAKDDLLEKIQTLNDCMCKFVDSSNTLKKVLSKEFVGRSRKGVNDESFFELGLEKLGSPDWERAHSEQLERTKHDKHRGEKSKSKLSAESYYF